MEEEKAAAYYEELTRKGEGAARFKQGLGFSSNTPDPITRGSSFSSSSFLSSFVKATSPTKVDKQVQLENIHNKLKKKDGNANEKVITSSRRRMSRERERGRRRRSRSRGGRRSRSASPRGRRRVEKSSNEGTSSKEKVDYSRLIKGYEDMAPAERVKAKMKLQLSQTADKDPDKGMGAGWERFEFNKDAPLDDEEIEVAEDDAVMVKKMSQSFRFSAVEARREEQIKAAHDEAMFGAPVAQPSMSTDVEEAIEDDRTDNAIDQKATKENGVGTNHISDKVLAKQQGSWRDRACKLKDGQRKLE